MTKWEIYAITDYNLTCHKCKQALKLGMFAVDTLQYVFEAETTLNLSKSSLPSNLQDR